MVKLRILRLQLGFGPSGDRRELGGGPQGHPLLTSKALGGLTPDWFAVEILVSRQKKAEALKKLTDVAVRMSEEQLVELRADIKVGFSLCSGLILIPPHPMPTPQASGSPQTPQFCWGWGGSPFLTGFLGPGSFPSSFCPVQRGLLVLSEQAEARAAPSPPPAPPAPPVPRSDAAS